MPRRGEGFKLHASCYRQMHVAMTEACSLPGDAVLRDGSSLGIVKLAARS